MRRLVASVLLAVAVACDPAVYVTVSNGCDQSVWVREAGSEAGLASTAPEEVRPGESLDTGGVGTYTFVAVSANASRVGTVMRVTDRNPNIHVTGPLCTA